MIEVIGYIVAALFALFIGAIAFSGIFTILAGVAYLFILPFEILAKIVGKTSR